jgi:hypothetical protein
MDSSTFGLPKNSRLGYRETINYATRISADGIYLHELDATVWAQGHTDRSRSATAADHRCNWHKTATGRSAGISGARAAP